MHSEELRTSLIVSDVSVGWLESAVRQAAGKVQVLLFDWNDGFDNGALGIPAEWELLRLPDFVDETAVRREFLRFLDTWPTRPVSKGRSFDDRFRRAGGYSVWWTGPGTERNLETGIFPKLKILWAFDRAIKTLAPAKVFIHSRHNDLATALRSRCERDHVPYEILDASARPESNPWSGRFTWLLSSLYQLIAIPLKVALRSISARLFLKTPPVTAERRAHPAIVFTSQFSRCVRASSDDTLSVWFWQALCDEITRMAPRTRCCHLLRLGQEIPGHRATSFFYHTAWPLLAKIDNPVPAKERYPALGPWLRSAPHQLRASWRYFRLEGQQDFRDSFRFAGADVSSMYVPRLRHAIAGMSEWEQTVGAIRKSLTAVGNVRALVVFEEMYRPGMLNIAAARSLGIPTIGVQHGTIPPSHLMYTLPPGQVRGAPIPDYFAAYGEYTREVMSVYGAYPPERVWIAGSPRFDELVNNPPDRKQTRTRLGLPADKSIVLVTTQTSAWFPAAVRAVFEFARERDDLVVCVKSHPKRQGTSDNYSALAQQVGAANVFYFDDRLDELLAACDVMISAYSTTILEAMLLARRTICANFSGEPARYPYVEEGGSVPARSNHEMKAALEALLASGSTADAQGQRQRFLARHAGPSAVGRGASTLARNILALTTNDRTVYDLTTGPVVSASEQISA